MATDATQHDWQIWIDYEPFEKERVSNFLRKMLTLGNRYRGFWHARILVLYNGTPDSDSGEGYCWAYPFGSHMTLFVNNAQKRQLIKGKEFAPGYEIEITSNEPNHRKFHLETVKESMQSGKAINTEGKSCRNILD
jgi:hypothetical protein